MGESLCHQHATLPGASLGELRLGEHDGIPLSGGREIRVSGHRRQVRPIMECLQQAEIAGAILAGVSTQTGCILVVGRFGGEHIGRYRVGLAIPDAPGE